MCDGKDVVPEVWEVLDKIKGFADKVRDAVLLGETLMPVFVPVLLFLATHTRPVCKST